MKTPVTKPKRARKKRVTKAGRKKLVDKAIQSIENKLDANEVRGTVGDLIRLLEFKKQMEGEEAREIRVTWVGDESSE